jgi:exopolysaccharide biosynthesis polyprenyl glycosylphosphotransferase
VEADLRPAHKDDVIASDRRVASGPRVVESVGDLTIVRDASEHVDTVTARPETGTSDLPPRSNLHLNMLAVSLMLAGSDILCLAIAFLMGDWLLDAAGSVRMPLGMVVVASALWVAVFKGFGLYGTQHLSAPEEFRRVMSATSIGVLLIVVATLGTYSALSRSWIGLTWFLALVCELAVRRVWRTVLYRWRIGLSLRTLVVGSGPEGQRLREALAIPNSRFQPIGQVSLKSDDGPASLNEVVETVRMHRADCLFVASTEVSHEQMSVVRRAARIAGADLRVSANITETLSTRLSLQQIGDVMTISLRPVRLTGLQAMIKRSFDLLLASVGLIFTLPLIGAIALAVKLTSEGPVLFRQQRVTSGGKTFTMYKFRTMVKDADRLLTEQDVDRSEAFFKLRVEPPLTRVGRLLRRFSLDELPQLWNIVKGDMSLVGPRPLPVEQVAANLELLEHRHEVRAGLTGWWQINGRSDVDAEAAVRMDLFYIENWSVALDLYILLKTAGALLLRRGAY